MKYIGNHEQIDNYIKKYNIYRCFNPESFSHYRTQMSLVQFEKKERIYADKEKVSSIFFLIKGKIKVCSLLSSGKQQLLNYYSDFGLLGDLELLNQTNPYTVIQAVTECQCIALSLAEIRQELNQDPFFLRYIAETLAQKLCKASSNPSLNIYNSLENRLAAYICFHAQKQRINEEDCLIFQESLPETAEMLGTSYRHLQRTLHSFKERNLLQKLKIGYQILDPEKIKELISDEFL